MRTLALSFVLGIVVAVVASLGLVSSRAAEDLTDQPSILTIYGER